MSYATSVIKQIQTGATAISAGATSATATITSSSTSKSVVSLRMAGAYAAATAGGDPPWTVVHTNATTLTLHKITNNNSANVAWQIVEYY
jgi:hypothetical protein